MPNYELTLQRELEERERLGNLRSLPLTKEGIDFFSNDYLGYSRSQEIFHSVSDIYPLGHLRSGGVLGATGSRLLSGNNSWALELESELSGFFKAESSLLFNSGFNLNLGLLATLPKEEDILLLDQNIHASLRMGAKLSKAPVHYFRHNDTDHLEKKITKLKTDLKGTIFVVTESLFSMDGDFAPLSDFVSLCKKHEAKLIVDEAHSGGLYGSMGEGLAVEQNLHKDIFIRIITFGKAFGCHGGLFLGPKIVKDYLINFCQTFIYTTALPLHSLLTIREAIRFRKEDKKSILELRANIKLFSKELGLPNLKGPIVSLILPDIPLLKELSESLKDENIKVLPIFSPTVKKGTERLRISLHSFNQRKDLLTLGKKLRRYLQ